MSSTYKHGAFTLFLLFIKCYYSYGSCSSLFSTETTTVTCKHNNRTLDNCYNPMEGTEAVLACNTFYEEVTLTANPNRLCKEGSWNGSVPQCYPICGKKHIKESSNRWINQTTLLDNQWHVGIYGKNKELICEGTLIVMNIILTSANCVTTSNGEVNPSDTFFVVSGKYNIGYDTKKDKFAQYSEVYKIYVPDEYTGSTSSYAFDIAILILTNPFVPSRVVQPVCIDFDLAPYNSLLEDNGIVIGWNYSPKSTKPSGVLRNATILYIPQKECYSIIGDDHSLLEYFTFDKICAKYLGNNGTLACKGDSGDGLIYKNEINDRYYIAAVLSLPILLSETICEPQQFRMFTAIFQHHGFMKKHTGNNQMQSCKLPNQPQHGKYVLNRSGTLAYESGYSVPLHSTLTLACNLEYNFTSSGAIDFHCSKNGQWYPTLSGCTSLAFHNITSQLDKPSGINYISIIFIVGTAVVFVGALVSAILYKFKFKRELELRRDLKLAGLDSFHKGNLKRFNPDLGIDGQAELLPYNYNYEFPRDKLKLGKQLGSGAFGVVMKADAFGIISNVEKTTVAVKTAKNIADHLQIKALIAELKVMVYLGLHLNVVNLLGACTQNIMKRELLVIVEYCQFGNLYNYLLQNRQNYIDQIDNVTGNIDYCFNAEDLASSILAVPNNSSTPRETDLQDSSPNSISNNSMNNIESEPNSNYCDGNKKIANPFYTKDLITWSFQIARGMEYLASRKILHGDLAARNILLAENNIIKICDFGLARRMYRNANYKKQKDCPLPIKWMAIESIRDHVFSTKSDVWSYGIVLWELFSLAQTPYPGMEGGERLYNKLMDGYKMESPPYAPKEMYKIMCDCWNVNPISRPSFNVLAGTVGLMLEVNVRQHYIDLNDPYLVMNTKRLNEGQMDYLLMLNPPDLEQSHNYIFKDDIEGDNPIRTSGYLGVAPIYLAMKETIDIQNNEDVL